MRWLDWCRRRGLPWIRAPLETAADPQHSPGAPGVSDVQAIHGPWLQTYSGLAFDVDPLSADSVRLVDIAHGLSLQCRYAGHTTRHYGVAEHSVLVALRVWQLCTEAGVVGELRRVITAAALLHDATEAYMVDIPKPWKVRPCFSEYRELEDRLAQMIYHRYRCEVGEQGQRWIAQADVEMLAVEKRSVMGPDARPWYLPRPAPLGFAAGLWEPHEAERAWLDLAKWLGLHD